MTELLPDNIFPIGDYLIEGSTKMKFWVGVHPVVLHVCRYGDSHRLFKIAAVFKGKTYFQQRALAPPGMSGETLARIAFIYIAQGQSSGGHPMEKLSIRRFCVNMRRLVVRVLREPAKPKATPGRVPCIRTRGAARFDIKAITIHRTWKLVYTPGSLVVRLAMVDGSPLHFPRVKIADTKKERDQKRVIPPALIAWCLHFNCLPKHPVICVDGNWEDVQAANLQMLNPGTPLPKGVTLGDPWARKPWLARANNKPLGSFATIGEAMDAYALA